MTNSTDHADTPSPRDAPPEAVDPKEVEGALKSRSLKILVAEDNRTNVLVMQHVLKALDDHGFG